MKPNYEHSPHDNGSKVFLKVAIFALIGVTAICCYMLPPIKKATAIIEQKQTDTVFVKQATDSGIDFFDGFKSYDEIRRDVDSAKKIKWEETK